MSRRVGVLLLLVGVLALATGCSGINASGSVSPATFLLPGFGQVAPQSTPQDEPNGVEAATSPVLVARLN